MRKISFENHSQNLAISANGSKLKQWKSTETKEGKKREGKGIGSPKTMVMMQSPIDVPSRHSFPAAEMPREHDTGTSPRPAESG